MDQIGYPGIETSLSDERFSRYLNHYRGRREYALRLYAWNLQMSAAMWVPISILEVALRNAIHQQLTAKAGREDWWESKYTHLLEKDKAKIQESIDSLNRRNINNPSPGQVVANSSFSLWVGLLDAGIPRNRVLSYETTLWQPRLIHAFNSLDPHIKRKQVHSKAREILHVRNRIAHHDPIFPSPIDTLLDSIDYLALAMGNSTLEFIEATSCARSVLAMKRQAITNGDFCSRD